MPTIVLRGPHYSNWVGFARSYQAGPMVFRGPVQGPCAAVRSQRGRTWIVKRSALRLARFAGTPGEGISNSY